MADICPPASGMGPGDPFQTRFLTCETDAVTACLDGPIEIGSVIIEGPLDVNILGQPIDVNQRALDCELDSVTICTDAPIEVTGSVTIDTIVDVSGSASIETKHPGVPGKIVPGSRWHTTGYVALSGTLTIVSPIPGPNQRVVCDWLDYSLVAASLSLLGGTAQPVIRDGGVGGTVIWQNAFGLLGTIAVGTTYSDGRQLVLVSSVGNELTYQLPATLAIFDMSLNFGGYLVDVS